LISFSDKLSDDEAAALANYVRVTWGGRRTTDAGDGARIALSAPLAALFLRRELANSGQSLDRAPCISFFLLPS
jgi:hypothetical protein